MKKLATIKYIQTHPNWREELQAAPYCLEIDEDENYALLKYNQIASDFNEQICRECRGLIINTKTLQPVALSFEKFFNYGEPFAAEIDWSTAKVQEKVDGSKILIWYDGYWHISTSGKLDAANAPLQNGSNFKELFQKVSAQYDLSEADLCIDICYTFELVSPENKVVIAYEPALYLIGARKTYNFKEINPKDTYVSNKVPSPKQYSLATLEDCLKATSEMPFNQEGFVVVDRFWNRIKIKSPAYVAAHRYLNGPLTNKRALDLIEINEIDEFLTYYPEYKNQIEKVQKIKENFLSKALESVCNIINLYEQTLDRKEVAAIVMRDYKEFSDFCFKGLDNHCFQLNTYSFDDKEFIQYYWRQLSLNKKLERLNLDKETNYDTN